MKALKVISLASIMIAFITAFLSCNKKDAEYRDSSTADEYDPKIPDSYASIADISFSSQWGPYNLHDPSILQFNSKYYIYSTDVMYGALKRSGIMFRSSSDLVHWDFKGWIFDGVPAEAKQYVSTTSGGRVPENVWAPCITKVNNELRLYYSVSLPGQKISCIGMATAGSPEGPWTDRGIVISTNSQDLMNAIDPSVIIDKVNGKQWMAYGSWFAGIFIVELDPLTGKLLTAGDKGHLIAYRNNYMDAIEGCEIIYNPELKTYFMFVSYDMIEDTYNVRVGRSSKPEGPYLDINYNNMAENGDNLPMITAQYRFNNHPGWQGFGHCSILRDSSGYFYVSQARHGSDKYFMDLHIRRIVWTEYGWPVISPERYAGIPGIDIKSEDIIGKWEHIDLKEINGMNQPTLIEFKPGGTISGIPSSSWSFQSGTLTLNLYGGNTIYKAGVLREWDWENGKRTIVYSGLTSNGQSGWGKKI
jgi:arabinan endo-1,5-alpha-L-arabinosidase